MVIGVICSVKNEFKSLKSQMENIGVKSILGFEFYIGTIQGVDVVVVKGTEGKVNAACCTTLLITNFDIDIVINLGIGVIVDRNVCPGDTIVVSNTVEADLDATSLGYDLGYEFFLNEVLIPTTQSISLQMFDSLKAIDNRTMLGTFATIDTLTDDEKYKKILIDNFNALCYDMECGSINHVCSIANVPFCAIKVASKFARAQKVKENIAEVVEKLNNVLFQFITVLKDTN